LGLQTKALKTSKKEEENSKNISMRFLTPKKYFGATPYAIL